MKEVIVNQNDASQRLDKFLQKCFPSLKKSAMYKAIRSKKIKVNRKRAQFDQILQKGDSILLFLPPDLLEEKKRSLPKGERLEMIYEDPSLAVAFKPAGLLSQKDLPQDQDTFNDRLLSTLAASGAYDPKRENSFVPSAAHRLDRNTSGLMAAGKTMEAARQLSAAIADHSLKKRYLALVEGIPKEGDIQLWMKKEGTRALVSDQKKEGYVQALMSIRIRQHNDHLALVEVELETGRFHQIRAGLAFLGHPLAGDAKYGSRTKGPYQLQAYLLDFTNTPFCQAGVVSLPKERQLSLPKELN